MKKIREIFNKKSSSTSTPGCSKVKEKIRIHVINMNGRILAFNVDPDKRLIDFKQDIMLELYEEKGEFSFEIAEIAVFAEKYRLIRADGDGAPFDERQTFEEIGIEDEEMMVLMKRRFIVHKILNPTDIDPPTAEEIWNATKHIPPSRKKKFVPIDLNEIFQQTELQFDVRKVLISLAQNAAYIIGAGPYAARLATAFTKKLANKKRDLEDSIRCLTEMGFTRNKAKFALKLHNGIYSKTLEWLLSHPTDEIPSDDESIDPSPLCKTTEFKDNIPENIQGLLDIVQAYGHRSTPPTQETINNLVEMGFERKEVYKALMKTYNHKAAAVEYLIGNRTPSLTELRDGLSKDSPILQAILDLPVVQLHLGDPDLFTALLELLERENPTRVYSSDSETSKIVTQVLQKYREEKHSLGLKQFYGHIV